MYEPATHVSRVEEIIYNFQDILSLLAWCFHSNWQHYFSRAILLIVAISPVTTAISAIANCYCVYVFYGSFFVLKFSRIIHLDFSSMQQAYKNCHTRIRWWVMLLFCCISDEMTEQRWDLLSIKVIPELNILLNWLHQGYTKIIRQPSNIYKGKLKIKTQP